MTVVHIVAFKLASEDAEERREQAARAVAELEGLRGLIPELQELTVGANDLPIEGNWDFALSARFADADALQAYQVHPEHQRVVQYVRSVASGRASVDFTV